MKNVKKMLALVIAMVMCLGMAMPAMAAGKTVTVTVNANGGTFAGGTTTFTQDVTVDEADTVVDFGLLRDVPNVTAADSSHAFDFWADSATATAENLKATISGNAATFYAVWKDNVPTNNRELDGKITVSGLETNDVVNFYQILKWDQDAVETKGWVAAPGFESLTTQEIKTILNIDNPTNPGISAELAAKLAKLVADNSIAATYGSITAADGAASQADPAAGLYMALITPGQSGVIYNPVFVAADYDGNETNSWALVNLETSYSPKSIAKKTKITLDKTAETSEDAFEDLKPESVAAGDTVTFRVETTIPTFADNYTQAKFFVEDHLSKGLTLNTGSIKVYPGWYSEATNKETFAGDELSKVYTYNGTAAQDAYTVTANNVTGGQDNYTVNFATNYLLRDSAAAQKITIIYTAEVTTDAPKSVNIENNTVEVHFSNSPTDGTGAGTLKDETKHYTFDLDANILGPTNPGGSEYTTPWQTTEVVKVGLDKDGNEITKTTTLHGENTVITGTNGEQKIGALEGAEFLLYKANADGTFTENAANVYYNDIMKDGYKIVSDSTGRLTIYNVVTPVTDPAQYTTDTANPGIRGLDIGTYYLKETKAPDGYIKAQDAVKIEIIAPQPDWTTATSNDYWQLTEYTDTINGIEVKWSVKELKKYEIKINGIETADYTFTNAKSVEDQEPTGSVNQGDTITGAGGAIDAETANNEDAENAGKITNTQGVELPSTGGIGTTMFYIIGAILVLGAGILLVTKRRMSAN